MSVVDRHRRPSHPGILLREFVLPETGYSNAKIADILGVSSEHLEKIMNAEAVVTPEICFKLGKFLGHDAGALFLNMQRRFDLWCVNRELRK